MDAVTTTALSKALTKLAKKARGAIGPGEYELDEVVTLRVLGEVKVAKDEAYVPTADIPLKVSLALFMRYAGVTGPAAMDALSKAMNEALEIEALPAKEKKAKLAAIREIANLEEAEERVRSGLDALEPKPRKGKVIAKVEVEEVSAKGLAKIEPVEEEAEVA